MYCTKTAGRDKMELTAITGTENVRDQLMDALKVTNVRMYDNVMRKMRG